MARTPPNVGDTIRHYCPAMGREYTGTVIAVLSSQFSYETDDGESRFASYNHAWKVTEKNPDAAATPPPPLEAPVNVAVPSDGADEPDETEAAAPPPLEPPKNPTEPEPPATFECSGCERAFSSERGLKIHLGSCRKYRSPRRRV